MYTIVGNLSIFVIIAVIIFAVVWYGHNVFKYDDAKFDHEYPSLYDVDKIASEMTILRKRLTSIKIPIALMLMFLLACTMIFVSSRQLSKVECLNNQGEWRTWDSGLAYQCFNPDLINKDNNVRVLIDE